MPAADENGDGSLGYDAGLRNLLFRRFRMSFRQVALHIAIGTGTLPGCASQVKVTYRSDPPARRPIKAGFPLGVRRSPLYMMQTMSSRMTLHAFKRS